MRESGGVGRSPRHPSLLPHRTYLQQRSSSGPQSLKDLIAFGEKHRDKEMPFFQQALFQLAEKNGGPPTDPAYTEARAECLRLASSESLDATLKKHNLDAIVAPTFGPVMPMDLVLGAAA